MRHLTLRFFDATWLFCGLEYDFRPRRWEVRATFAIPLYAHEGIQSANYQWVSTRLCAL